MSSLTYFCEQHQLGPKLNHLFQLAQRPDLDHAAFQQQMESFDRIKADGMKFAERRCRRLHMGLVQFSPMLNFWRQLQELWQLVI